MGPTPIRQHPYQRENMFSEKHLEKMPCEDEGRDQGDASSSQGTKEHRWSPATPIAQWGGSNRSPLCAIRRNPPFWRMIMWHLEHYFQAPVLWDNHFLSLQPPNLTYFIPAAQGTNTIPYSAQCLIYRNHPINAGDGNECTCGWSVRVQFPCQGAGSLISTHLGYPSRPRWAEPPLVVWQPNDSSILKWWVMV